MTIGTQSSSGGLSPEKKDALVKIGLTALLSIISVIFGVEITMGGVI